MKCQSQNCSYCVKNYIFVCKKTHAQVQYAFNSCAKFQNECLKTLRGVDYTILLPLTETQPENRLSQKCCNFVKNYFRACLKSHAHFQYANNICEKFQIDCLKTLGGVDYTNLLPNIEA